MFENFHILYAPDTDDAPTSAPEQMILTITPNGDGTQPVSYRAYDGWILQNGLAWENAWINFEQVDYIAHNGYTPFLVDGIRITGGGYPLTISLEFLEEFSGSFEINKNVYTVLNGQFQGVNPVQTLEAFRADMSLWLIGVARYQECKVGHILMAGERQSQAIERDKPEMAVLTVTLDDAAPVHFMPDFYDGRAYYRRMAAHERSWHTVGNIVPGPRTILLDGMVMVKSDSGVINIEFSQGFSGSLEVNNHTYTVSNGAIQSKSTELTLDTFKEDMRSLLGYGEGVEQGSIGDISIGGKVIENLGAAPQLQVWSQKFP